MSNEIKPSDDTPPLGSAALDDRSVFRTRSTTLLAVGYVLIGVGLAVVVSNLVG